jgi:hypothetical protein
MNVQAALEKNQKHLMSLPGVVGVGIGGSDDAPVIVVMITHKDPRLADTIPR